MLTMGPAGAIGLAGTGAMAENAEEGTRVTPVPAGRMRFTLLPSVAIRAAPGAGALKREKASFANITYLNVLRKSTWGLSS